MTVVATKAESARQASKNSPPAIDMFCYVWYKIVMFNPINTGKIYTPEQVANLLQLSKNTVYGLIGRGEIVAKKIGKVYRIPAQSLSFVFTGLDYDLYKAEMEDRKILPKIQKELDRVRKKSK